MSTEGKSNEDLATSFKLAMRQLAASVTLVTTHEEGVRHGMPATAVCSLSAEPPSLLVCVNRSASMHGPTERSRFFSINVLGHDQAALCKAFGARASHERFDVGVWSRGRHELPRLEGASAVIFCAVADAHVFGTHTIFVGAIEEILVDPQKPPLLFLGGAMGRFSSEESAPR